LGWEPDALLPTDIIPLHYHPHAAVAGVLLCLSGWSLYRFSLRLSGLAVGGMFGASLGYLVPEVLRTPSIQVWTVPIGTVLLAWIFFFMMEKIFRILIALCTTMVVFLSLITFLPDITTLEEIAQNPGRYLILLGLSLVAGMIAMLLQPYLIIILTAWIGACLMAIVFPYQATLPVALAVGLLCQFGILRLIGVRNKKRGRE
jgi:hypothetical protein